MRTSSISGSAVGHGVRHGMLVAGLLLASMPAWAVELARVEGFGPVSRGFAGGGVAYPVGAAAMLLNPAELLRLESDHELLAQVTEIHASITVSNPATGEKVSNASLGNNRGPYDLPELAYAQRRGHWAFGTGVFATGGFGIEYGNHSFLSRTTTYNVDTGLPVSTRVAQMRIPLALAWQPAPQWRLGASLDVVNSSINLASLLDAQQLQMLILAGRASGSLVPVLAATPNLAGAHINFVRNNFASSELAAWGVAGRLGVSYQASENTSAALVYEFKTVLSDLKGNGAVTVVDASNNHVSLSGEGRLPAFQFPQAWVLGIAQRLTPQLAVTADLRRTYWAEVLANTQLAFRSDSGGTLDVSLPTGFRNLNTLTLGVEWRLQPQWTLRAGGSHAFEQLVSGEDLSGSFPTLTRNHLSLGLSYRLDPASEFNAGVSYGFTGTVHNPGGDINSIPAIDGRNRQINPVLSYSRRF